MQSYLLSAIGSRDYRASSSATCRPVLAAPAIEPWPWPPTVQTEPAAAERAGALLARAFHDDAMFCAVQPDAERRRRRLPWFFTAAARLGQREGEVHMLDGDAGAAIWLPPGDGHMGAGAIVRSGLWQVPARFGPSAFRRFTRITGHFDRVREQVMQEPYWHLFILGVEPEHQGRGLGGELIAPGAGACRRVGPAVLPGDLRGAQRGLLRAARVRGGRRAARPRGRAALLADAASPAG